MTVNLETIIKRRKYINIIKLMYINIISRYYGGLLRLVFVVNRGLTAVWRDQEDTFTSQCHASR